MCIDSINLIGDTCTWEKGLILKTMKFHRANEQKNIYTIRKQLHNCRNNSPNGKTIGRVFANRLKKIACRIAIKQNCLPNDCNFYKPFSKWLQFRPKRSGCHGRSRFIYHIICEGIFSDYIVRWCSFRKKTHVTKRFGGIHVQVSLLFTYASHAPSILE